MLSGVGAGYEPDAALGPAPEAPEPHAETEGTEAEAAEPRDERGKGPVPTPAADEDDAGDDFGGRCAVSRKRRRRAVLPFAGPAAMIV